MKVLFFDVGYTLVNEDAVWERRCREQAETEDAKKLGLSAQDIYHEIEIATISRKPQFRTVTDKYNMKEVVPYRTELETMYQEVPNVIKALAQKYELGIIANQLDGLKERLEAFGLLQYFKYIISSWDVKVMKPDIRIFEYALGKANCKPQDACMIGDRLDNDILPAKSLGMKTVWIKQGFGALQKPESKAEEPDYTIEKLPELLTIFNLPENIQKLIKGKPFKTDDIGKSGSKILMFDDCVLKIEDARDKSLSKKNDISVQVMRWLKSKLPVPEVLAYEADSEYQYLLMSRVSGKISCDEYFLEHPHELCRLLAQALKMLWSIDVSDCPYERTLDKDLEEAEYRVQNNLIDVSDAEPETYGKDGFENPEALLTWLKANRPKYEPVLSHGDFCLPNVLIQDEKVSGFIDLGDTGIGDKWDDIAMCYRSLKHNFDGTYGGKVYPDFNPDMLFEELGIEPDWEKIKFYILLDELF